jgi:hypothetical protein
MMSVAIVAERDTGTWIYYLGRTAAQREGLDTEEAQAIDQGLTHLVEVGNIYVDIGAVSPAVIGTANEDAAAPQAVRVVADPVQAVAVTIEGIYCFYM